MNGIVAPVDLSFEDILDNLDMALAATFAIRKDKWTVLFDAMYLNVSPTIEPAPLAVVDAIGIELQQFVWQATVVRRVLEWGPDQRSYLDAGLGVRGIGLDQQINFQISEEGVAAASYDISSKIVGNVASEAQRQVSAALPEIKAAASDVAVTAIAGGISDSIEKIDGPEIGLGGPIGDLISDKLKGRLQGIVQARSDVIKATVQEQIAIQVSGAKSAAAAKAGRVRANAERKLANQVNDTLSEALPENAGLTEWWADPILAVVARHYFSDKLYLNAYGDIGGFGVGSDLTAAAAIGPGYNFGKRWALETYYRYLYVDYENNGFVYDMNTHGLFLGAVLKW